MNDLGQRVFSGPFDSVGKGLFPVLTLSFVLQFLDMQDDEELRTHLNIFHEHKEEDLEEFSHRYDNIRMEIEYPCP